MSYTTTRMRLLAARAEIDGALRELEKTNDEEVYADVLFIGQAKSWTYRLPQSLLDEAWVGRYVSVKDGVFKKEVGRIMAIHRRRPAAPYVYDVSAVVYL